MVPTPSNPLSRTNLSFVITELDEVGIAASVTGSGRAKLSELAMMGVRVAGALQGERKAVAKVRTEILRRAHDVRVSPTKAKDSSRRIHALRDAVLKAESLVKVGLGIAPPSYDAGRFQLANAWGYTEREMKRVVPLFEKASTRVKKTHLDDQGKHARGVVLLKPGKRFCAVDDGVMVCDPDRLFRTVSPLGDIFRAIAVRVWLNDIRPDGEEVWEMVGGLPAFEEALVGLLSRDDLGSDTRGRLRVSLGVA